MEENTMREEISNRLVDLRNKKGTSQGVGRNNATFPQSTMSEWEANAPKQLLRLRQLAQWYEVSADYILSLTDDPAPKPKRDLSPDERSILDIMKDLPPQKREEVIQLAEVVLRMHRKEEIEDSKPSLLSVAKEVNQGANTFGGISQVAVQPKRMTHCLSPGSVLRLVEPNCST